MPPKRKSDATDETGAVIVNSDDNDDDDDDDGDEDDEDEDEVEEGTNTKRGPVPVIKRLLKKSGAVFSPPCRDVWARSRGAHLVLCTVQKSDAPTEENEGGVEKSESSTAGRVQKLALDRLSEESEMRGPLRELGRLAEKDGEGLVQIV